MPDEVKEIFEEAVTILTIVKKLREAKRSTAPISAKLFQASELAMRNLPPRGEPPADAHAADAFTSAIRFWARRAAASQNYDQWEEMAWRARDAVPDFPGDPIRVFENAFEGLRLRDGSLLLT
jgi:hypothetical protein